MVIMEDKRRCIGAQVNRAWFVATRLNANDWGGAAAIGALNARVEQCEKTITNSN